MMKVKGKDTATVSDILKDKIGKMEFLLVLKDILQIQDGFFLKEF